jgi:hypothetical protein
VSAVLPPAAQRRYPAASWEAFRPPERHPRQPGRLFRHPLMAICVVQAALSLTLVWSNTAYLDEADYLWVGRLELAHWLHGTPWPSAYAYRLFSGSPLLYPPLGALADSIGGLAGARVLSLAFMLGATVLLYLTASRLIGPRGAAVAAALWALSEPAIRLAFATFDPLSIFLTALSAWLIVQADHQRRHGALVAAAAAALAVANVTAYSGIAIDPVVIAFAFLVWLPRRGARQAAVRTLCLAGCSAVFFGLLMSASHSWAALMFTVIARQVADYQSAVTVLGGIWGYSGLIMVLAIIGAIAACNTESKPRAGLLALLGAAAFIVPVAQLHDQTAWSLDKHLAYGIWFAAIASGYGCDQLIRWFPGNSRQLAAVCCAVALAYVGSHSWQSAWQRYHTWPNAGAFISAFKPVAARSQGLIYVPGHEANIAQYYTPQGREWQRWNATLPLDPAAVAKSGWQSYYTGQLNNGGYGVIALFYSTTFSTAPGLSGNLLLSPPGSVLNRKLLNLVGEVSGEPGLPALTLALEADPDYTFVTAGPYSSAHNYGIYAIWEKVPS